MLLSAKNHVAQKGLNDEDTSDHRAQHLSGLNNALPPGAWESLKSIWRDFRREHSAFVVTCLYLIFEYNRPHMIYPALDIIPWGKTLLLLAIFLAFSNKESSAPPAAAVWPMTAFSVCVLISTAFAFSPAVASEAWVMFFGWLFVVLLFTSVVNTRKRLFLFLVVYFLVNLKMAQHGFSYSCIGRG